MAGLNCWFPQKSYTEKASAPPASAEHTVSPVHSIHSIGLCKQAQDKGPRRSGLLSGQPLSSNKHLHRNEPGKHGCLTAAHALQFAEKMGTQTVSCTMGWLPREDPAIPAQTFHTEIRKVQDGLKMQKGSPSHNTTPTLLFSMLLPLWSSVLLV